MYILFNLENRILKNNQIKLRKRQIQKYRNTENTILNSNMNFVEKRRIWETLCYFIWSIIGTVKLHTDYIVNKSVVLQEIRITENSCNIIHVQEILQERFLMRGKSQGSYWVKKIKQAHDGKTSRKAIGKFECLNAL